ncbi:unnamed protein product, partial [marine sediment metagenome]
VTLVGRLGQDPEVSAIQSGDTVANFSIAMTEYYKKDDQKDFSEETTWISITAWRKLAERVAKFAQKGTEIAVQGKLREKKWEDKETGAKRSRVYVLANKVDFGEGRIKVDKDAQQAPPPNPETPTNTGAPAKTEDGDDLPF